LGDLSEFPLKYRLYLKAYRWRRIDPVPWTPLQKPLKDCRLALVSSAGFVTPDQKPFGSFTRLGDDGIREIPADTDVASLHDTHRSKAFDHSGIRRDPNLAFPADRLRELADAGFIGRSTTGIFRLWDRLPLQLNCCSIPSPRWCPS